MPILFLTDSLLFCCPMIHNNFMRFKLSFLLFLNIQLLNLILEASKSISVDFHYTACSVPTSCGAQKINFPFYIPDQQLPYCGYPGFELSCQNKTTPILTLPDQNPYIVHEIFYQNQSINVSRSAALDLGKGNCIPHMRNTSVPNDRFQLTANVSDLLLFYGCNLTDDKALAFHKVICEEENVDGPVVALIVGMDDSYMTDATSKCKEVARVPVDVGKEDLNIYSLLRRGFVMKWVPNNCSICEKSGGRCGFNNSTDHFNCFCPDGPDALFCAPTGTRGPARGFIIKVAAAVFVAVIAGLILLIICFRRTFSTENGMFSTLIKKADSVFVAVIAGLILLIFCFRRIFSTENGMFSTLIKKADCNDIEAFLRGNGRLTLKRYSFKDVKKMTNKYEDKLGEGGFGAVYKGKLSDGCQVAVKVLNNAKDNGEAFMNEVASISRTSHVNIVTLLGFCFEGRKRALIYEYVPNGSLEKFIHQENPLNTDHQLKLEILYQIAVGVARGLEYLHRGCNIRILHFDIKPHNILLDDDFCPKISDFGLAKLCPRKESIISMVGTRGTPGYIAPEVYSRNFGGVSHKSDVYSYGMMVLEMVGGRKNINAEIDHTSEIYFPDWIHKRLELDDLGLQGISNEDDRETARKMMIVGLWCIQTNPSNRPQMSRVVEMLQGNLDSLEIPPKPYLSSPPRSPPQAIADSSSSLIV